MDRRKLLQSGIALGGSALAGEMLFADGAEAAAAPAFFLGTVSGTGFESWTVFLVVTGTKIRGSTNDPASIPYLGATGTGRGLNLAGSVRRGQLNLIGFALEDFEYTTPIAAMTGQILGSDLTGAITMGGSTGTVAATRPVLRAARTFRQHLGRMRTTFTGFPVDGGVYQPFEATITIAANGTITASKFKSLDPNVTIRRGHTMKVYYFVDVSDRVFIVADRLNHAAGGITILPGTAEPLGPSSPRSLPAAAEVNTGSFLPSGVLGFCALRLLEATGICCDCSCAR